mmetsp:Transcript_57433/g.107675  ORF Transcript_57433/g.107675 Transcript_57433/m.107675 type:complete len:226 (+) Transcript_57433:735-1412(+)
MRIPEEEEEGRGPGPSYTEEEGGGKVSEPAEPAVPGGHALHISRSDGFSSDHIRDFALAIPEGLWPRDLWASLQLLRLYRQAVDDQAGSCEHRRGESFPRRLEKSASRPVAAGASWNPRGQPGFYLRSRPAHPWWRQRRESGPRFGLRRRYLHGLRQGPFPVMELLAQPLQDDSALRCVRPKSRACALSARSCCRDRTGQPGEVHAQRPDFLPRGPRLPTVRGVS